MGAIGNPSGGVVEVTSDKHGLGRWTKMRIAGKDGRHLSVFGAYRAPPTSRTGPRTVQFQQRILLISEAIDSKSTDPRARFIDDFIEEILNAQAHGDEIVIGTDINAVINQDADGLDRMIQECGLVDLLQNIPGTMTEPPGTYDQSNNRIDYLLGTERACKAIVGGGCLPYGDGIVSNHQGMFIDLSITGILGKFNAIPAEKYRIVRRKNVYAVKHYKKFLLELFAHRNIIARAADIDAWSYHEDVPAEEIEALDKDITRCMIAAEKQCGRRRHDHPWSPELMKLGLWLRYWRLREKVITNHRSYNTAFLKLEERIKCAGLKPDLDIKSIRKEKCKA